jgi:hypothetical protein
VSSESVGAFCRNSSAAEIALRINVYIEITMCLAN